MWLCMQLGCGVAQMGGCWDTQLGGGWFYSGAGLVAVTRSLSVTESQESRPPELSCSCLCGTTAQEAV